MKHLQRWVTIAAASLCALFTASTPAHAQHELQVKTERAEPWSDEIIDLVSHLPIQDGGRIKPFSTFAGFTLLRLNGKRSLETPSEEKIGATEWLLDTLFFPLAAAEYPSFLVQNVEVIAAMGLRFEGKKNRDRYSFVELQPGLDQLFGLARQYHDIPDAERTTVQRQIVILDSNLDMFLRLAGHMDFAKVDIPVGGDPAVAALFEGRTEVGFHELIPKAGELRKIYEGPEGPAQTSAFAMLRLGANLADVSAVLAVFPPTVSREEQLDWLSPADLFYLGYEGTPVRDEHLELIAIFGDLSEARMDQSRFETLLGSVVGQTRTLAQARGEYGKIPLEVTYYKAKLIYYSLVLFVLAFLGSAFLWLKPASRVLYGLTSGTVFSATFLLVGAIVMRCIIRGRPPVSTLYETLLFVGAVGCLTALVIEWINRRRIAISVAAILGMIVLFLANGYELLDKQDTMPSLVAVLDTNFWLATHVTAITAGYAAGMLAAFLASFYLIAKLIGVKRGDRKFYSSMGKMVYGIIAFAVIFSTVGTILGGVWANDSWGRFWGWDPKENGALLIVISQLAILHARMGGYIREHGVCMAAAFGGTIIAFSWFGVNLLGVGLHSYGFTNGIHQALWTYYGVQWGICGLGALAWFLESKRGSKPTQGRPAETQPA